MVTDIRGGVGLRSTTADPRTSRSPRSNRIAAFSTRTGITKDVETLCKQLITK
ncbi:hypothetical protein ACFQ1S_15385 [Kibdelosporangium lantanae]|uniref:Uncharacterized protein n=1 Tax=Kibdelosporangium lantanae TaxID=1497396 RepID=A0ABW3M8B6_9PSEU